ncbi:MAG: hypothetical protein WD768_02400 [Phycisphaeraceae bacterium]
MPRFPRHVGFTLVETLLVIALIALLIAMLMPSLGSAKENARRVKCASQVRSLVDLSAIMANEDNQRLPDLHNDTGKWSSNVYLTTGPNAHTFDIKARDHIVKSYGQQRATLYCPSNNEDLWNRDDFWTHTSGRSVFGYTYFAAAPLGHAAWTYTESGSSTIFASKMTDKPRYNVVWSDLNREISPYSWYRYDVARGSNHYFNEQPTGSNEGFMDSHVEWVPYNLMKPRMKRGTWTFWW